MLSKYRYKILKYAFLCINSYDEFLQKKEKFRLLDWCNDQEAQAYLRILSPDNSFFDINIWVLTTYGLTPPDYELKDPIDEFDALRQEFLGTYNYSTFLLNKEKYRELDWFSDAELKDHLNEIVLGGVGDKDVWMYKTYGIINDSVLHDFLAKENS